MQVIRKFRGVGFYWKDYTLQFKLRRSILESAYVVRPGASVYLYSYKEQVGSIDFIAGLMVADAEKLEPQSLIEIRRKGKVDDLYFYDDVVQWADQ